MKTTTIVLMMLLYTISVFTQEKKVKISDTIYIDVVLIYENDELYDFFRRIIS